MDCQNGGLRVTRKSGAEKFRDGPHEIEANLLNFWRWSCSDLVSNTMRGVLAEYIVGLSLGIVNDGQRKEWDPYDLLLEDGTKIEVKSAAYVQSWKQDRDSAIQFGVPKRRAWDPERGILSEEIRRHADVYVLALLHNRDRETIDPMDLAQWEFYIVPTVVFDERERSQHSITLPSLKLIAGTPVNYSNLREKVLDAAATQRNRLNTQDTFLPEDGTPECTP